MKPNQKVVLKSAVNLNYIYQYTIGKYHGVNGGKFYIYKTSQLLIISISDSLNLIKFTLALTNKFKQMR